jgi:hypothetical protein
MSTHADPHACAAALEARWDRIGLGVRCAYNPARSEVLHHYVQTARRLSRLLPAQEARIQRRMLELLLRTAGDEALPWTWRALCLEHLVWPLARLTSLRAAETGAAEALAQIEERVQRAIHVLGMPPCAILPAAADTVQPPGHD